MSVTRRQRPVPASMFVDEPLLELDSDVRLTGIGLRFYVDDLGRGSANTVLIKGSLWALREDITEDLILEHLVVLDDLEYIQLYDLDGRSYLQMVEWPAVDRGASSRIPPPPARDDPSRDPLARPPRETPSRDPLAVEGGGKGRGGPAEEARGEAPAAERAAATVIPLRDGEPSPFCSDHSPTGTEKRCGPCGTARKRHELWQRAQLDEEYCG
jgi:hypothetical protein